MNIKIIKSSYIIERNDVSGIMCVVWDPCFKNIIILPIAQFPGVDSASNKNEYQEYFLGVKSGRRVRLTTLPPSWATVA